MPADIKLCSECQKIDFESLFFVPDPNHDPNAKYTIGYHEDDGTRLWWTTYNDLVLGSIATVASRQGSCDLCAFVLEAACQSFERYKREVRYAIIDSDESDAETMSQESSQVSSTGETSDTRMCARKTTRSFVPLLSLCMHSDG